MAGTLVANTINTDTGLFSTNNAYTGIAKAWVNFQGGDGNTSGTINGSFNVSSVTVNGTGSWTVNFATAMSNANYSPAHMTNFENAGAGSTLLCVFASPTTTTCGIYSLNSSSGALRTTTTVSVVFLGA